VDKYLNN